MEQEKQAYSSRELETEGESTKNYVEKLIKLNRVAKVVKGGRRFSFSALMVVGDHNGNVGYGFGKANDVSEAIRKGLEKARRSMIRIPIKNFSLAHAINGKYKSAKVIMLPAAPGTGVIAGGTVRAVMEACGVNDILTKSLGSRNAVNVIKAVFNAFENMLDAKKVAVNRGKTMKELWS